MNQKKFIGEKEFVEGQLHYSSNFTHCVSLNLDSHVIEITGYELDETNLKEIGILLRNNKPDYGKYWNIVYKAWRNEGCSILGAFPLNIEEKWHQSVHLNFKQRALGELLSEITKFSFQFEGNKNEPKVKANLENKEIIISGVYYSCDSFDTLRPLVAWIKEYFKNSKILLINIALKHCGKHGIKALLAFFKYLLVFSSKNVKINLYCPDDIYKENWEEDIDIINEEEGINIWKIVTLYPSNYDE